MYHNLLLKINSTLVMYWQQRVDVVTPDVTENSNNNNSNSTVCLRQEFKWKCFNFQVHKKIYSKLCEHIEMTIRFAINFLLKMLFSRTGKFVSCISAKWAFIQSIFFLV